MVKEVADDLKGVGSNLSPLPGLDLDFALLVDVHGDLDELLSEHELAIERLVLECHLGEGIGVGVSVLDDADIFRELISDASDPSDVLIRLRRVMPSSSKSLQRGH